MGKTLFPKNDSAPRLSSPTGFFLMSTTVTNLLGLDCSPFDFKSWLLPTVVLLVLFGAAALLTQSGKAITQQLYTKF